jgi:AcrR family transcriptional regulator
VSRGALYHHFANKEALLEAVYEAAQAGVVQEIVAEALAALPIRSTQSLLTVA